MRNREELIKINNQVKQLIEGEIKSNINILNDKDVNLRVSIQGLNIYIKININNTFGTDMAINYYDTSMNIDYSKMELEFEGIGGIGSINISKEDIIKSYITQGELMRNFQKIKDIIEKIKISKEYLNLKNALSK